MDQNKRRLFSFFVLVLITASCQFPGFGRKSPCDQSVLKIGENTYRIKTIAPKSDGSLKIPSNNPDIAYWVEGTNTNYVFALSPTENNLALEFSLKNGDTATITWDNCNSTTYNLAVPQSGVPSNSILFDQTVSAITIFIQPDSAMAGFVIEGELMEETISVFNTPDPSEMQAEISLLETTTSADGKTIRVSISILNNGQSPITLSASDVSLTPENATAVTLETSEPALPKEIKTGANETIYLTFIRPSTPTATLKVFTVEYELEDY